jgi:hypothetical protein
MTQNVTGEAHIGGACRQEGTYTNICSEKMKRENDWKEMSEMGR